MRGIGRWRLILSGTRARRRRFLRNRSHPNHVQGSQETDRACYCCKYGTPPQWSAPADKGGTLKSERPVDIGEEGTYQPRHRTRSEHQHRISETIHLGNRRSCKKADQEPDGCKPIQPHKGSDSATCVAISLPLDKERINRNDVDLFTNFDWGRGHGYAKEAQMGAIVP